MKNVFSETFFWKGSSLMEARVLSVKELKVLRVWGSLKAKSHLKFPKPK